MLVVKNINKGYYKKVISHFSYSFNKNKIYSIIGPSGCGKSTLLEILSGINKNYNGDVFYNDVNIKKLNNYTFLNVSYVYQSYQLFDNLTALENVTLPLEMISKKVNIYKINILFKYFNIYHLINTKVKDLSGGEKQRIALIRAFIKDSDILLLDEPTSALDFATSKLLMDYLNEIKKDKIIILVTHDQKIADLSDEIIDFNQKKENKVEKIKEKNIKEEKIKFAKIKYLYKKVFKNKRIYNYITTYILTIGLIGIALSNILSCFINDVTKKSLNTFNITNALTLKGKSKSNIIDFNKLKYKDYEIVYYEGINSLEKVKIKEANLISYVDFNYYDIKNTNFIFDNYLSEHEENITLAIPLNLKELVKENNYLNIYFNEASLSIKVDKIIQSTDDSFYIYCNNTSYLNPIFKSYSLDVSIDKYLYSIKSKGLYNYLINDEKYNSFLFYLDEESNVILIKESNIPRINKNYLNTLKVPFIYSDFINTYIDYDSGFIYLLNQKEAIQIVINNNLNDNEIAISNRLKDIYKDSLTINNINLKIVNITSEDNYFIINMNLKTFNSLNDDLIYVAILFTNDLSNIDLTNILINKNLFKIDSFKVFDHISNFILLFSCLLVIEAFITSIFIFSINFMNKKKEVNCLLNLGVYKNILIKLLLYDPIKNIASSIFSSILSYIISKIAITYIYAMISHYNLDITFSISILIFLFLMPILVILPFISYKLIAFLNKKYKK